MRVAAAHTGFINERFAYAVLKHTRIRFTPSSPYMKYQEDSYMELPFMYKKEVCGHMPFTYCDFNNRIG